MSKDVLERLERSPVIAAVHDNKWQAAIASSAEVIIHLNLSIFSVSEYVVQAHSRGKLLLVHVDLLEGIAKDKQGIEFLKSCGVDGIVSTKSALIRFAKSCGLTTVQRMFLLDSQGIESMDGVVNSTQPDFIEIMPGVVTKEIVRFSKGKTPVIAGGLLETKAEVTAALSSGAIAVSTGKEELWSL